MKDWQKDGYSIGDTRSKAEKRADREREMAGTGMSWKATRRRRA
jgi:hypothetical protein